MWQQKITTALLEKLSKYGVELEELYIKNAQ